MASVGVVVPAFRPDVDRLEQTLAGIVESVDPARLRVELDGPDAGVPETLREGPATIAVSRERRGKGRAITGGFEAIVDDVDLLLFTDADGSVPAESLVELVGALDTAGDSGFDGGRGLAVGSRRHPDANVESHQTAARRRLGDVFAWTARRVIDPPLHDYQCGAKAITAETWRRVRGHLYEPGFGWDLELIAMTHAIGDRVVEVPVTWADQPGSTVAPLGTGLELASTLLHARHRAKRLHEHPLHEVIGARSGSDPVPLVDRQPVDTQDD